VDWLVLDYAGGFVDFNGDPIAVDPQDPKYLYLYQIENTSAVAMDALSITMPAGAASFVLAAGNISGDDLDAATGVHPAHAGTVNPQDDPPAGTFPLLNTEEGPFPLVALTGLTTNLNVPDGNITWTFNPLAAGRESDTLYFIARRPPIYGDAVAQDSTPPSPWGSRAPGGDPLPVPAVDPLPAVPEPSTLVLLGVGSAVASFMVLRRRSKS
jgi:hypothetical protein